MGNLRRRPWLALLLPVFLLLFARAARRRAARDADLVHAHRLPSDSRRLRPGSRSSSSSGGTDVELAARAPWLFRPLLRRARLAIVASEHLAGVARASLAHARRASSRRLVEIPLSVGEPDEPHVLFVGRLSPEKGIEEFVAATDGPPAGDRRRWARRGARSISASSSLRARAVLPAFRGRLCPLSSRGLRRRRP